MLNIRYIMFYVKYCFWSRGKATEPIFPTQFYKLEPGVISNIESWENDFEYEYGLKSFSYSYSLLMLTSSDEA